MTSVFEKRRSRLHAMRELFVHYVPSEQLVTCQQCGHEATRSEETDRWSVCPACGYHEPMDCLRRLAVTLDSGKYRELNPELFGADPLAFPGYAKKTKETSEKTGLRDAVMTVVGRIQGYPCVVCVMDNRFMMGSMGAVVGEKITQAIVYAARKRLPLIIFCASGGARMQEGIISLMQMAKTSAALKRFSDKGLLYISVLTNPTMGGVTASFASLGDVILAEPGALIGFAGPRVIEQTIGEKLPAGFQRAEFMAEHGFVDAVVPRQAMRSALGDLLMLHERGGWA